MEHINEYTRILPHIQPLNETFFITFRLYNSLPKKVIQSFMEEKNISNNKIEKTTNNPKIKKEQLYKNSKQFFINFDELLHKYQNKNDLLLKNSLADIVKNSLHYYDNKNYNLISYCIMTNHVHLLISEVNIQLFKILQSIKSFTAKQINKKINSTGKIWQRESYDHIVRENTNINNYVNYILQNPVKAGLVSNTKDWKYNYFNDDLIK